MCFKTRNMSIGVVRMFLLESVEPITSYGCLEPQCVCGIGNTAETTKLQIPCFTTLGSVDDLY